MKLHATITNEAGTTVSKGRNESLEIKLYLGNKLIGYLNVDKSAITYQSLKTPMTLEYLEEFKQTSTKQQGKKCINGFSLPCEICPKDGLGKCTT